MNYALSRARFYESTEQWQSGASAWKEAFQCQDTLYKSLQEQTTSETQARLTLEERAGEKTRLLMELEELQRQQRKQKVWLLGGGLIVALALDGLWLWKKRF